jgi:hypothetical protein
MCFIMYYKNCTTHSSCKNIICNQKTHLKGDDNTKNSVEMDFFSAFFGPPYYAFGCKFFKVYPNLVIMSPFFSFLT